jgi:hypothetical protein
VSLLFSNPELIRNARIHLRPGRMIAAAVICAVVSVTTWTSISHTDFVITIDGLAGAGAVFALILNLQIGILLIGGGIFCLQSVHREKELNTFDYQRVTRLTSLELTLGKLFGAPIAAYFVALCLMPVALVAAITAHVPAKIILEVYLVLLLGSITYHALALLISVVLGRGSSALGILSYLAAVGITYSPAVYDAWTIRSVSPFFAGELLRLPSIVLGSGLPSPGAVYWRDLFFGEVVPHMLVLFVLYTTFTAWFLVGVRRNLKRDPPTYEIYSPVQAFSFTLYLSLLMIGFFPCATILGGGMVSIREWVFDGKPAPAQPNQVEQTLLQTSMTLFAILALILLRNRDRARQRARELGSRGAGPWAALWPAPYLVGGVALVGGLIVSLIDHYRNAETDWDWRLAVYCVVFLATWLTRDALYLQWMNIRRAKRPLISAILYLAVFYGSACITFGALNLYDNARSAAATAILVPTPIFALDPALWRQDTPAWIASLVLQAATALVFSWLHRQRLREFGSPVSPESTVNREIAQSA